MADIIPFKGILYNPEKIKDIGRLVTPPYDVISPDQQEEFYNRDEHNMIRLDLGREFPEDTATGNRYTRAADDLSQWLSTGVLIQDNTPSIYYYELVYTLQNGTQEIMKGFIAPCRLEDFEAGKILPHEYTLSKPKSDRLNLLRACKTNLSLIFSLYSSTDGTINDSLRKRTEGAAPRIDLLDDNNIRHRLWSVSDPDVIDIVKKEMKDKTVYIADGHHRYEASLNYRNAMRQQGSEEGREGSHDYVMMYFANMDEPGLTILPTHRVVYDLPATGLEGMLKKLERNFILQHFSFSGGSESGAREQLIKAMDNAKTGEHLIGTYIHGENRYVLLSLKEGSLTGNRYADKPLEWRRLDVSILQSLILEDILGFSEEAIKRQENIMYVKNTGDAIQKVHAGDYQIAFLLNPTRIEDIKNITSAGERMPQKSTYFYPKFLTGLVMYKF